MDVLVKQKKNKKLKEIAKQISESKNLPTIQSAFSTHIIPNIPKLLSIIGAGIKSFTRIFLKPFWFSTSNGKKDIVVPYVYSMINQICIYASVYIFLRLSWLASIKEIHNPEIVLPAVAGIVGVLIAFNHSTMSIYNTGKQTKYHSIVKDDTNNDKPEGVQ